MSRATRRASKQASGEAPGAPRRLWLRGKRWAATLGPGLVTGASDDDPSGIATYSQAGAQFGNAMLWTLLFSYPLMSAIQEISARIGRVTGHGVAGNLSQHYPRWVAIAVVGPMVVANTLNIGADLAAMGAATAILTGGPSIAFSATFALVCVALQMWVRYARYAAILRWITLSLFAYVGTAFVADIDWAPALRATIVPSLSLNASTLTVLIAVLGTTISPYLFFWQASQEVEELHNHERERPLKSASRQARRQLWRIKVDTYFGMAVSNLVAFFIMLTCAATLHEQGITDIQSPAQAAEALRPLAGRFATILFAAGIVGTGLLAVPVLGGSAAYAVAEVFRWPIGLDRRPGRAKGFYAVLFASTIIGLGLGLTTINPIKALFWSAIINGIVAVPVMVMMMLMARNRKVVGQFVLPPALTAVGWSATIVMALAAIGMVATSAG